eukprot:3863559-Amphidinium_carterae.1
MSAGSRSQQKGAGCLRRASALRVVTVRQTQKARGLVPTGVPWRGRPRVIIPMPLLRQVLPSRRASQHFHCCWCLDKLWVLRL